MMQPLLFQRTVVIMRLRPHRHKQQRTLQDSLKRADQRSLTNAAALL